MISPLKASTFILISAGILPFDLPDAVVEFDLFDLNDALVEGHIADILDGESDGGERGAARPKLMAKARGMKRIESTFLFSSLPVSRHASARCKVKS